MGNAPDMSSSFTKAVGGGLIFLGISLFAISGSTALAAGTGFKAFAGDAVLSAMTATSGYVVHKAPEWAAAP